jgi:hypothetical protein
MNIPTSPAGAARFPAADDTPDVTAPMGAAGGEPLDDDDFDDLDESLNRYGGLDRSNRFAHRVVTPQLLAGLTGAELSLCRAYHRALFQLLEDLGDFDGLIATSEFFADTSARRLQAADEWLSEHPSPDPSDGSPPDRLAAADHSLELAVAMDTNPSLTFGSMTSLVDRLVGEVLEVDEFGGTCSAAEIEFLTAVALVLLASTAAFATTIGGARVWAAVHDAEMG